MLDRFKDAKWYILPLGYGKGDPLNTIIYDASDLEGDGPDGHGMVCQDAVIEDARLIAASPDLLAAAKAALDRFSDPALEGMAGDLLQELEEAIAKAEGRAEPLLVDCKDCFKVHAVSDGCAQLEDQTEGRA